MPLLRKTGVRSPWLPSPLQGSIERVRPAVVVLAIAPAVLLGGNVSFVGRPQQPNTAPPARPAVVVTQPVPIPGAVLWQPTPAHETPLAKVAASGLAVASATPQPPGASVWMPRPLDAGVVAPPDKLSPTTAQVGAQPLPGAAAWMPAPARVANTDPLHPPIVVADPPDPTLVQPSAQLVGRLSRSEDSTRPARPALVHSGQQPVPGTILRSVGVAHDGDRIAPTTIVSGQQPIPLPQALPIGQPRSTPAERLAPPMLARGAQPVPQASATWLRVPLLSTAPPTVFLSGGTITGSGRSGSVAGVGRSGTISSPGTAGTI